MKNYYCSKCGSIDIFIDDRGIQKALMCGDCGKWIKWIGNKELPLVKRFIEENKQANKCEWDEIGDVIQDAVDRKGMTKKERVDLGDKIISEVRSSKKKKENANDKLNKWMNGIDKKILTNEKKKILKENMGRVSSKNIDFNKIRDEWRDELEEERVLDRYDFMSLVKDILESVDDDDLDNMKEQLIDTINFMVESEKRYAELGIRVRR